MGTFSVAIQIGNPTSGEFRDIEALVGTGATYTLIPSDVLEQLDIRPVSERDIELADQTTVRYEVGEARMRLNGDELAVLLVFAPPGTSPLLGATALELFGLAVDPLNQRLMPVPALLKSAYLG